MPERTGATEGGDRRRVAPKKRTGRPTASEASDRGAAHIQRSDRWNGLRPGDPVQVAGVGVRGASWQFRAHVRNVRNGHESIEVIGGREGDRSLRSFAPERIYPVTSRPPGRSPRPGADVPSLVDAPRLPLE